MSTLLAINHLLNFVAPAFAVALLMVAGSQVFDRKRARSQGWIKPFAINFVICTTVLLCGLVVFGDDGKIWTYGALVVISATSQFLILRAWRG
ncbi:hypothetical protein [Diaphorobacter ruginosibacter]|uniref:hypothetical protein n=1 Tax=Diaphorobacter ruginosibacter TaxID=1715720 RepID=UPI00334000CB